MIIQSDKLVPNPKVSVVIATYNQKEFIEETIMSALNQKCDFPFEIVVGDDGSNDGQRELLKEIQKRYPETIKLLFNDENLWVTKNYVNAIKEANGLYIATLDGDDIWINEYKLKMQIEAIESDSSISLVHTGFVSFESASGSEIGRNIKWESPMKSVSGSNAVVSFLTGKYSYYPLGSSSVFRKDQYLKYIDRFKSLIEDKNSVGEGTLLNVMLALQGRFHYIPECCVKYRVLPSSLSHFSQKNKRIDFAFNYTKHKLIAATCATLSIDEKGRILDKCLQDALIVSLQCHNYKSYSQYIQALRKEFATDVSLKGYISSATSLTFLMKAIIKSVLTKLRKRIL